LLSGDFVFVGDVGRPDLLDEAAGFVDTRFEGAHRLFLSLENVFLSLPDHVQVWPGHGAGSACGKALGAVASTTVGYERRTAWWRAYLERNDEAGFVETLLEGQPDAPTYFGRMKRQNKEGPALLAGRPALRAFTAEDARGRVNRELVLIDTRTVREQWAGSVPGSLAIPGAASFATYASYVIDPERETRDIVVLADSLARAEQLRDRLSYVGIDNVVGYLPSLDGLELARASLVTPAELRRMLANTFVLDVRTANEFAAGAIPGAVQIHAGRVLDRISELPRDGTLVLYCQGGGRSAVVASALRTRGFGNVIELDGSYDAWVAAARDAVLS
jgi:hydroxyacylglutathione hydrolase